MYGVHSVTLYMFFHRIITVIGSLSIEILRNGQTTTNVLVNRKIECFGEPSVIIDDDVFKQRVSLSNYWAMDMKKLYKGIQEGVSVVISRV